MAENGTIATTSKKAKSAAAKARNAKTTPQHPKVSEMVNIAISSLKSRGGSSAHAIKKYIAANYKVNVDKLSPFIKKYLKSAVTSGILVQTKGKGASGSFKMGTQTKQKPSKLKSAAPKPKIAVKLVTTKKPAKSKSPKKELASKKAKAKTTKKPTVAKSTNPKAPKSKKTAGIMKIGRYNKAPSMMVKK